MGNGKDFWKELCKGSDYRFFTGVPFKEANNLYSTMDSEIMHYVPAANEHIALQLATGAWVSGFKSGIILTPISINRLNFDFNINFEIPILIITVLQDVPLRKGIYTNNDLTRVVSYIENQNKPGVYSCHRRG